LIRVANNHEAAAIAFDMDMKADFVLLDNKKGRRQAEALAFTRAHAAWLRSNAGLRSITVRDATPIAGTGKRFMRLQITQP
jgi:hypothetical protein